MSKVIRIPLLLLAVCLFAGTSNAQHGSFGMGVIVGEPTGLSLKAWQSNQTGLDFLFGNDPLDLFVEVVPILDVAPDSDVSLNASVGMRYWP